MDNIMERPIQIYLDSDDYSKLSDLKILDKEPRKREALSFLLECIEKNIIEIRYSVLSVAEITHLDDNSIHYAKARAKLLMRLTEGKCFRPFQQLFVDELIICGIKKTGRATTSTFPEYAYSDGNDWLDRSIGSNFQSDFRTKIREQVKQILRSSSISRVQKKQAEKNIFHKKKLSQEILQKFKFI
jgi:hypothetical protein